MVINRKRKQMLQIENVVLHSEGVCRVPARSPPGRSGMDCSRSGPEGPSAPHGNNNDFPVTVSSSRKSNSSI